MESVALTLPAAMVMGLSFGAGPCNITCLPYLGPVFLAREGGIRRAWRTVVPFSAGRLTGYAALGTVAGLLGHTLHNWLQSPAVHWALGGATVMVGLSLLWRQGRGKKTCATPQQDTVIHPVQQLSQNPTHCRPPVMLPGGLFVMGAGMALNPCAPLSAVLLASAATGSAAGGLTLGLGFGLGAVFIPALVFGLAVAHMGAELREHLGRWRQGLERTTAAALIALGTVTAIGWVQP